MTKISASGATGAELLRDTFGEDAALARAGATFPAVPIPWEQLSSVSGWAVWLGHPPVPSYLPILPVAAELIWDDPLVALAAAAAVSLDYAVRRGAMNSIATANLLRHEAPTAVIVPGDVHPNLLSAIDQVKQLGIPVVPGADTLASIPSFAARAAAHGSRVSVPHDPALSFQTIEVSDRIGGNPLSSFVLHHEGERDGVTVIGDMSARLGVEIGVLDPKIGLEETAGLEAIASTYPSFLDGVTSRIEGHSLRVAWASGYEPRPQDLGEVIRAWLKALQGLHLVDVRIAFAPPQGRSAFLTDMRARASAFKEFRSNPQG